MNRIVDFLTARRSRLVAAGALAMAAAALLGGTAQAEAKADASREIECLALTIYHEARGEPGPGQIAVGHVVMNRVADRRFPRSVCKVVDQGSQRPRGDCHFSWRCDARTDQPSDHPVERAAWRRSQTMAQLIYWGLSEDPTHGALWYHADYVNPSWRKDLAPGPKIGRHIFYLSEARFEVAAPGR
jgi:spore germination cell wall hydrolase CwlJ-like protein